MRVSHVLSSISGQHSAGCTAFASTPSSHPAVLTDPCWCPAGADGFATPQYAAYGATKAALPQLLGSLQSELAGSAVGVHIVSPGMMLTELLLENASVANKQVGGRCWCWCLCVYVRGGREEVTACTLAWDTPARAVAAL